MATISIADNDARIQHSIGSGGNTANSTTYAIDFPFFALDDIDVTITTAVGVDTVLSRGSGAGTFAVSGTSVDDGFSGGSITLGSVYTSVTVTITRDIPISRTSDFATSGPFNISSLNTELDKVYAVMQQIETNNNRSLTMPDSDALTAITLPGQTARLGTVLGFNASTGQAEVGPTIANVSTLAAITTNINALGSISADVTTVAGISANVTTVAGISSNVTSVAGNATNINTVAGKASLITSDFASDMALIDSTFVGKMDLVTSDFVTDMSVVTADFISDLNDLATTAIIADLDLLATSDFISDLNAVEGIKANVTTVAGISSNVTSVAGNATNINSAVSNASNINSAVSNASNINSAVGNASNINSVVSNASNINTVAGAITNVNNVGGAITNINTVATNIASVNNFAEVYRIDSNAPTTSLDVGDLYFDTTSDTLKVYGASGWQNAGSSVNGTSQRYHYDIGGAVTSVTGSDANGNTLAYDAGYVDVYVNGVRMSTADVTVTSGDTVTFAEALASGDEVDIVGYGTFSVASLNADNLSSGTVPDARVAGAYTGITSVGTLTGFTSTGIDDNATSTAITIDSSENVGIGTASPASKIHASGAYPQVQVDDTATRNFALGVTSSSFRIRDVTGSADRLTITSSGRIGISTSSPDTESLIDLGSGENSGHTRKFNIVSTGNSRAGFGALSNLFRMYYADDQSIQIGTVSRDGAFTFAEKMRIDSAGKVYIGTTTNANAGAMIVQQAGNGTGITINGVNNTSGAVFMYFTEAGANCGYIQRVGTTGAVTYATSSDYRLKENVVPMTGALAKVSLLNPVTYDWIAGGSSQGFIAHELQEVIPDAVTGVKDQVNEDGSIKSQGVDTSYVVATLTSAIQEQQALIEALTARITALEGA